MHLVWQNSMKSLIQIGCELTMYWYGIMKRTDESIPYLALEISFPQIYHDSTENETFFLCSCYGNHN